MHIDFHISGIVNSFLARKRILNPSGADARIFGAVCDALEVGNYRLASTICTKSLRKFPASPPAPPPPVLSPYYVFLTFQALCQFKLHQLPEALKLVSQLKSSKLAIGDPDVLVFLEVIMAGLGQREEEILLVFEEAVKLYPDNDDVLVEAFIFYIRQELYKKAQQLGLKILKSLPTGSTQTGNKEADGNKYFWWTIMTTILQVQSLLRKGDAKSKTEASLPLAIASRMFSQHLTPPNKADKDKREWFETQHQFFLLAKLLKCRLSIAPPSPTKESPTGSTGEQFQAIDERGIINLLAKPINAVTEDELRAGLIALFNIEEGKKWCSQALGLEIWRREEELEGFPKTIRECWERMKAELEAGDTNWHSLLSFVRASVSLSDHAVVEQTRQLLQSLSEGENSRERGYILARIELELRLRKARRTLESDSSSESESSTRDRSVVDLLVTYFQRFASKTCCFDDLRAHLKTIEKSEQAALLEELEKEESLSADQNIDQVQRLINYEKIKRVLTLDEADMTIEKQEGHMKRYLKSYFDALPLGKGLPSSDLQPADDFAMLAAQACVSLWSLSKNISYLQQAVVILEFASKRSKHKYQLRVLLIRAPSLALSHWRLVGCKQIQMETISHYMADRSSTFSLGLIGDQTYFLENLAMLNILRQCETETGEMIVRTFSYQNYTKSEDFVGFKLQLRESFQRHVLEHEHRRLKWLRGPETIDIAELTLQRSEAEPDLVDNRDFSLIPDFQPYRFGSIDTDTSMGPKLTPSWLKKMSSLYRYSLLSDGHDENASDSSGLTAYEGLMVSGSDDIKAWNNRPADKQSSEKAEESINSMFTRLNRDLKTYLSGTSDHPGQGIQLPWELLHVSQISLEMFQLYDQQLDRFASSASSLSLDGKGLKKMKLNLREQMKGVAATITAAAGTNLAKDKEKQKWKAETSAMLSSLTLVKEFPLLDEDFLYQVADNLSDSRKKALVGVSQVLTRRCQK
ncbi:hypothetical protein BT69DRAFT_1340019 [Atractiella rhizophila]|nr:hypothetical protein BT69DRAFT_1340019 [Atractiella rhizophila]